MYFCTFLTKITPLSFFNIVFTFNSRLQVTYIFVVNFYPVLKCLPLFRVVGLLVFTLAEWFASNGAETSNFLQLWVLSVTHFEAMPQLLKIIETCFHIWWKINDVTVEVMNKPHFRFYMYVIYMYMYI